MELFDVMEFASYVSPLSERLEEAGNRNPNETAGGSLAALSAPHSQHPSWRRGMNSFFGEPEDLDITSSDSVHFYVHQARLLVISSNMFNGRLAVVNPPQHGQIRQDGEEIWANDEQQEGTLHLPETGDVLNILLFAAFNRYPEEHELAVSEISLQDLRQAIIAMETYGIALQTAVSNTSMVFDAFTTHCQRSPSSALQVYAIAASHAPHLHTLAVYASQFLLSLNMQNVTEGMVGEIGGVYLQRLFALHLQRVQDFKRLIVAFPQRHAPMRHCSDTKALEEAWTLARAYLAFVATPNVPDSKIDDAMRSVVEKVRCNNCKEMLRTRFQNLKHDWSLVNKTIQ